MTEDELLSLALPPQVDIGDHSLNVAARAHEDGAHIELRHPEVGGRTYRVMAQGVVHDEQAVFDWISMVAPAVRARLDAEDRFRRKQAGYTA